MKSLLLKIKCAVFGDPSSKRERDPSLDNIRFLLIFLVVFAHLLEICTKFTHSDVIYKTIYSFHMPAFIFLFGYNARFGTKRIVFRWGIPYLVFQTLYILFSREVLLTGIPYQYTTPHWLLWYMLACLFYQLLIPLYDVGSKRGEIAMLILTFVIALWIGYEETVGYYLSLSRFFVFQPWFVMGYYCQKHKILDHLTEKKMLRWNLSAVSLILAIHTVVYLQRVLPNNGLLYGSYPYESVGCTAWSRALMYLFALAWICLLLVGIKPLLKRKLPLITMIGQNTWPIFLAHGFVVRLAPKWFDELLTAPAGVLVLTCGILIVAGNPLFRLLVDAVSLSWLEKVTEQKPQKPNA